MSAESRLLTSRDVTLSQVERELVDAENLLKSSSTRRVSVEISRRKGKESSLDEEKNVSGKDRGREIVANAVRSALPSSIREIINSKHDSNDSPSIPSFSSSASSVKSLTKEKREEIIAQLLVERRERLEGKQIRTSECNVGDSKSERSTANKRRTKRTGARMKRKKKGVSARTTTASVDRLKADLHRKYLDECTFRPKINTSYKSKQERATGQKRLDQLSRSRLETLERREKQRYERFQKESKECTFRPKTNKNHRVSSKKLSSKRVSDRLYDLAGKRVESRQRAAMEKQRRSAKHSYKPSINPDSEKILDMDSYQPLQERIGAMQRAKTEKLQQLRMEVAYGNADLTFRPKIDRTSKKIVEEQRRQEGGDKKDEEDHVTDSKRVEDRLLSNQTTRMQRKIRLRQRQMAEMSRVCRFQPRINETSKRLVKQCGMKGSFLERQEVREVQKKDKYMRHLMDKSSSHPFRPEIGNADAVLMCLRPERVRETPAQRVERLSRKSPRQFEKIEKLKKEAYKDCTFNPQIDPNSKRLGRSLRPDEMVEPSKWVQKKKRDAMKEASKKFSEMHPFKPKRITRHAVNDENYYHMGYGSNAEDISEKIERRRALREKKLARAKSEQLERELKDCTFRPNVAIRTKREGKDDGGCGVERPRRPVVVRGLGRYLELKELAKRKEEEKRRREREVFCEPPSVLKRTHTVPKPFTFASKGSRRKDHTLALRDREMAECTFQPKRHEGETREYLERLLDESSFRTLRDEAF